MRGAAFGSARGRCRWGGEMAALVSIIIWSNIQFAAMYYLKVVASPVFFERYKQCLHTLMIALLILN